MKPSEDETEADKALFAALDQMMQPILGQVTFETFVKSLDEDEARWLEIKWFVPMLKRDRLLN